MGKKIGAARVVVKEKDLPEIYQEIARIVGVDNAVRLSEYLGGMHLYFPKIEKLLRDKRDAAIREEFTGFNHRALAHKYGLSEKWIRAIVQERNG